MKNLSKTIAVVMTLTLLVGAAGCSNSAKTQFNNQTTSATTTATTAATTAAPTATPAATTTATTADKGTGTKDPTTLVMGTNAAFPPFEYLEGSAIVGFDADLMAAVAKELGLTLKITDMEFDSLPTALSNGQIDVIAAGLSIKPDREETMDFATPYYDASQTIIIAKDSKIAVKADLNGKKIGVQTGTTGETEANKLTSTDKIKGFANGMLAVEALKNGQVDAVIIDNNPAAAYVDQNADKIKLIEGQFDGEQYALAVAKGNSVLLEKINAALAKFKTDGTFDTLYSKYIK